MLCKMQFWVTYITIAKRTYLFIKQKIKLLNSYKNIYKEIIIFHERSNNENE